MPEDAKNSRGLETLTIQDIMKTEGGRHFMWRILEQSGVYSDCFDPDPYIHAKNSGNRLLGLWLQNELIDVTPASYITMIKEHTNE